MQIAWAGRESFLIDINRHLGKRFVAYGQTNLQEDLFGAADRHDIPVVTDAGTCSSRASLPAGRW